MTGDGQATPYEIEARIMAERDIVCTKYQSLNVASWALNMNGLTRSEQINHGCAPLFGREHNPSIFLPRLDGYASPYEANANKTTVYRDTVVSQRVMVGIYLILPLWMALLVPMVTKEQCGWFRS